MVGDRVVDAFQQTLEPLEVLLDSLKFLEFDQRDHWQAKN